MEPIMSLAPLIGVLVLMSFLRCPWRMAVLLLIVSPLVASLVLFTAMDLEEGIVSVSFKEFPILLLVFLAFYYPYLVNPVAAFTSALATLAWKFSRRRSITSLSRGTLYSLSIGIGAISAILVGILFGYLIQTGFFFEPHSVTVVNPNSGFTVSHALGSLLTGAVEGFFLVAFLNDASRDSIQISRVGIPVK
jgi:hypothetical protein